VSFFNDLKAHWTAGQENQATGRGQERAGGGRSEAAGWGTHRRHALSHRHVLCCTRGIAVVA